MNTQYSVEEWAVGTTRGRRVFNYNYRMVGTEIKGWKLLKVVTMQDSRDITEKVYIWQSTTDPAHEMVRVGITERHHWRLAQESLHQHLMHCMRPDIPKGTKKLAELGDVVFVSREPHTEVAAAISFTRGNVCVIISTAGEKNVDVSDIASRLDGTLSKPPAKSEVEKGQVHTLAPQVVTVQANEPYVLIKNLQKVARRGAWLKIIVPDGELARKVDALVYVSPQGGQKQVGVFRVGGD